MSGNRLRLSAGSLRNTTGTPRRHSRPSSHKHTRQLRRCHPLSTERLRRQLNSFLARLSVGQLRQTAGPPRCSGQCRAPTVVRLSANTAITPTRIEWSVTVGLGLGLGQTARTFSGQSSGTRSRLISVAEVDCQLSESFRPSQTAGQRTFKRASSNGTSTSGQRD